VWIIAIIVALIAIIVLLVMNWDKVSKALGAFGEWAKKGLGDAWKAFSGWCNDVGKALGDTWNKMTKGAGDAVAWIGDQFKGLANKAGEWGANLVKAFADGMGRAKKWLEDRCNDLANSIKNFLGIHSPPKEGPLHDIEDWGTNLVGLYAKSLAKGIPQIQTSLNMTLGDVRSNIQNGMASSSAGGFTVIQHIYHADEDKIAAKVIEALRGTLT